GRRLVVASRICDRRRSGEHLSLLGRLWLRQRLHSARTSVQSSRLLPRPPLGERLLLATRTSASTPPAGQGCAGGPSGRRLDASHLSEGRNGGRPNRGGRTRSGAGSFTR